MLLRYTRTEGYLIFAVLVQLCSVVFTLLFLRESIINQYGKFRHERFDENLRRESNRHARNILSEISKLDYHTPPCNKNQFPDDVCAMFQDVFQESSFQPYELPDVDSGIFGSCLQLVKRMLHGTKERAMNLRHTSYKPFSFRDSFPYVNLGDFIFSSDRQWIPTGCDNATKVAVLILTNTWDVLPWKYSFLRIPIISLQRLSVHFGIFVADDFDRTLNRKSLTNFRHLVTSQMAGWDHVVSFSLRGTDNQIECVTKNINEGDTTSVRNINYTYNDVTSLNEARPTTSFHYTIGNSQLLFRKIPMSSTMKTTAKKRSGLRRHPWRLTNLKLSTDFDEEDVQVSKSKVIPADITLNELQ